MVVGLSRVSSSRPKVFRSFSPAITLHVNPAAANINTVVAHEIGHSFEYMAGADVPGSGWRWGFGTNGAGGNGFWEQIAQWEAFKVYPERQFTDYDFDTYITSNHKHILHETPRYGNYFIGDWWAYKRGLDFMEQDDLNVRVTGVCEIARQERQGLNKPHMQAPAPHPQYVAVTPHSA